MNPRNLHRWSEAHLYVLAVSTLLFSLWVSGRLAVHPEIGASWSLVTGIVDQISPDGPAYGRLLLNDQIVSVDGFPPQYAFLFPAKHPGDWVRIILIRQRENQTVPVRLVQPSLLVFLLRLEPILIAALFWGLGIVVLVLRPTEQVRPATLFFLFCQIGTLALGSGAVSSIGPLWTNQLFDLMLWWLGPLAVDLHYHFPVPMASQVFHRVVPVTYGLATFGSLLDLAVATSVLHVDSTGLYAVRRLWLIINLLMVVLLLAHAFRRVTSPEERYQVGLVTLGGGVAFMPLLLFSVLPDALLHQPLIPYEVSFLFLLSIPLAYGYAIQRYRLIRLNRYISRSAASLMVLGVLGSFYLLLYALLNRAISSNQPARPAIDLLVALVMAAAFGPLHHRCRIFIDRLFYGGWYDYRSAVQGVSQALDQVTESAALAQTLSDGLQKAMQLEFAYLLKPDFRGGLTINGQPCPICLAHWRQPPVIDADAPLARYFRDNRLPVETTAIRQALGHLPLSMGEKQILACGHSRLWFPLVVGERLVGVLILGPKRGGDAFDPDDLEILEVVIRQAAIVLLNGQLMTDLQAQLLEGDRLHRQAVRVREEERKRVARELHDQIIQALVGLNYGLAEIRTHPARDSSVRAASLQSDVRRILNDVRRICTDLRPPTLDSLGLVSAVRSRLRAVEAERPLEVAFAVEGDPEQNVPEDIALCLFRVLQEALTNVQRHSEARRLSVRLRLAPESVQLLVEDDGRGFVMPRRLGQLTEAGHFGLLGLHERLEVVNGTLEIVSIPGQGTRLEARVPLPTNKDPS